MSEHPPRTTKKVEVYKPTDLDGVELQPEKMPPSEMIPEPEQPTESRFIETERTLGRLNDSEQPTPAEFKKSLSSMFDSFKGLPAVTGREARGKILNIEGPNEKDVQPEKVASNDNGGNLITEVPVFIERAAKLGVIKEKAAMKLAETEYLTKYKEFHAKNGVLNRLGKSITGHADMEQLEQLKKKYDESRLEYAKGITAFGKTDTEPSAAFKARTEKRFAERVAAGDAPKDYFNKPLTLEQYAKSEFDKRTERLVATARYVEVIRPAARRRIEARQEALNAKGQNAFQKGLSWVAEKNQSLEKQFGKNGARAVRALASTIVVAGGAAAVGSFGTASLLALAGWGTFKFTKSFAGSLIGAAAGEVGATTYEKVIGKNAQLGAKKTLKGLGKNADISLAGLQALDKEREKLIGRADERTLENKKNLVKALVAFGVGAGTAATFAELQSLQHASHILSTVPEKIITKDELLAKAKPFDAEGIKIEKPNVHFTHHDNMHIRHEHHPHASAGQEVPAKPTAPVEVDRSAEIAKIQQDEVTHGGISSAEVHSEYENAISHAQTEYTPSSNPEHVVVSTPAETAPIQTPEVQSHESSLHDTVPAHDASASQEVAATPHDAEVIPETPVAPVEHLAPEFEHAPASVNTVIHSEVWEAAKGSGATNVLLQMPADGSTAEIAFRDHLLSVVRASGLGPTDTQSVEDYLKMASSSIQDQIAHGTENSLDLHPAIYEVKGVLQVHGGNFSARFALANEYHRLHPNSVLYVEHLNAEVDHKLPMVKFPIEGGVVTKGDPAWKAAEITADTKKVF